MTSKRPVTHPALQRAYSTHEPAFGEADNARQAALLRAIKDCRDDPCRAILQADRLAGEAIIRAEKAEAERDDLLAMKARVEIVADDLALCTCEACEGARSVGWRLRAAIRGES